MNWIVNLKLFSLKATLFGRVKKSSKYSFINVSSFTLVARINASLNECTHSANRKNITINQATKSSDLIFIINFPFIFSILTNLIFSKKSDQFSYNWKVIQNVLNLSNIYTSLLN